MRKLIASKGHPEIIVNGIMKLLEDLEVEVLIENVEYREMLETAAQLKLLPSDTIITFDKEGFKRVPWLEVVP